MDAMEIRSPLLLVALVLALSACPKSEPPAAKDAAPAKGLDLSNPTGIAAPGKAAIVSQQCSLACGAKPGIDSGACTAKCIAACGSQGDVDTISACANKTADGSPQL
jgi:hypothetical protein